MGIKHNGKNVDNASEAPSKGYRDKDYRDNSVMCPRCGAQCRLQPNGDLLCSLCGWIGFNAIKEKKRL